MTGVPLKMIYRLQDTPNIKPMTLGGVQFGLDYGISNTIGKVPESESLEIIRHAITEGIQYIDTAAVYGDSEKVIGKALKGKWSNLVKIITKLSPMEEYDNVNFPEIHWSHIVRNSVLSSCVNLNMPVIHAVMLHRASQLHNETIIKELLSLKRENIIKKIGVSVQTVEELKDALINEHISIIQMPYNLLDNRWDPVIENLKTARKDRGLLVHARSSLLQGLLCTDDLKKWDYAGILNSEEVLCWLDKKYRQYKKTDIADLCIGYVNSQDWIDSVVVGVTSLADLFANLRSISMPFMQAEVLDDLRQSRPIVVKEALNPYNWGKL
jgi:aryl-alcohol dehydrogenase-like predicted oxidoreductase